MSRTADAMALDIILSNRSDAERRSALKALAASVDHTDAQCPECGSRDLTGNDAPTSSSEYTLLCLGCGEQHCPNA
jgi:hypothetical protein